MAPPPIRSIFLPRLIYAHQTNVPTTSDDVCIVCRDSYTPPGQPGCHAIRLTRCGHIVGHECFHQWITRHPEMCPCLPHTLPAVRSYPTPAPGENPTFIAILVWLCNTTWFSCADDFIAISISGHPADLSLHALRLGLVTRDDVLHIAVRYFLATILFDFEAEFLAVLLLGLALVAGISASSMLMALGWVTFGMAISNCAFMLVVWGVLRTGLRRSEMRQGS